MSDQTRQFERRGLWGILFPVLLWSAHFIAVYALTGAACGSRGLIDADAARLGTIALAALSLILLLLEGWYFTQRRARDVLGTAALWSAIISGIAIAVQTIPATIFTTCG